MSLKTQKTHLFTIDPEDDSVLTVGCVLNISGVDSTIEQIETTCLEDEARTYVAGLATPGAANFGINFDPSNATHVRLHALKRAGTVLPWAIGFSDGTADPTVETVGEFELPTTRSWLTFDGFINSFPFEFAQNAVVNSNIGLQISGDPVLTPKST